jgi:thiopeptide-type bacteriocin biosynthesis protein
MSGLAEWLYVKVYTGDQGAIFDDLILVTIPVLVQSLRPQRWFFIRYRDEHGVHLRIRLQVSLDEYAAGPRRRHHNM